MIRTAASCEVRAQCLEYALETDQRSGVWGGLSERERFDLKARQAADGTRVLPARTCASGKHLLTPGNTYLSGGNRCRACRLASKKSNREQQKLAGKAVA